MSQITADVVETQIQKLGEERKVLVLTKEANEGELFKYSSISSSSISLNYYYFLIISSLHIAIMERWAVMLGATVSHF